MRYRVFRTFEFEQWLDQETKKSQVQIEKRLANIEIEGHFGTIKDLGDNVLELKWSNGRRVFCAPARNRYNRSIRRKQKWAKL